MSPPIPPAAQEAPGHKNGREVEWQLAASSLGSVRRWLTEHESIDHLVVQPSLTLQLFDTYFDTDDWRIYRAGFALRIRVESGNAEVTLKSLHSARSEVADRRELSEVMQSTDSEAIRQSGGPVGTRVQAVAGAHALQPLFEVRTSRERFAVRREDEPLQLGEIALDETVVSRPHGEPSTSMQRVEVEALTDAHEPLQMLVKVLRSDCALEAAEDSKYSLGLKSVGLAPAAPQFAPTAIDASMRIDEAALANLRRYLSAWLLHEPGARLGDDPEELHDLRVAGRRIDGILRQFADYLPAVLPRMRPMLKRVLRVLGEVRDFDVALSELERFSRELSPTDRAHLEPLKRHLSSDRVRARARMLSVLDSTSVQRDMERLTLVLAQRPTAAQDSTYEPTLRVAPEMIRARYRKMRKGADRLSPDSTTEAYHAVRGQVKKLRYALEAVAVIYGKPADDMLRALRRWQERLGIQNDAYVASRRLQSLASAPPKGTPPATLFLMGRLAEHHAGSAARARRRFAKGYRKVRAQWKDLREKLEAAEPRPEPRAASRRKRRKPAVAAPLAEPAPPPHSGPQVQP